MLAGPPPTSFNTSPTLPTVQTQTNPSMYPNQFQPPTLPPNFVPKQPTYPPMMHQPPALPPNYSNSQYTQPSTMPSNNMAPMYPTPPPTHSPQPPMMNNAASSIPSNYMTATNNLANGYSSAPPPMTNGQYPQSHPLPPPPPPPPSMGTMNGMGSYPPSTGAYPNPSGLSGPSTMPGPSVQQSYPSSRIDPDMVPNVVQVLEQSQEKITEPFVTSAIGTAPPLVATEFACQDHGSCNPRFIRSTMYAIPNTADMIKQSQIPISLSISPLAKLRPDEFDPPLANFGELGPIRCQRCKAYMCSHMQFIDGGKRFVCCFCEAATEVPTEYFNHLDHTGRRMDYYQRPELCLGAYEIAATKKYCKDEKWPEPPAFIFMIDVSYNSIRSGLVHHICQTLKNDLLDYLPKDTNAETSNVRVGFATFDKQIHFYNISNTLGQPQMMIVSDLEEIFVPLLNGFLCPAQSSRGVINSLLDQIPQTFLNTQETETILAPVIESGIQAMKGANCSGKIYVFSSSLPIATAPGKLTNRDDKKLLGTDKEKTLLAPVNNVYTKLGEECAQNGCAIDLFLFANNYCDLATIGELCHRSGGEIYKYNYFSVDHDGERLTDDLKRNFQRTTVFDAMMRVRTSSSIRPVDFLGNFYMTNTTEMIFGSLDADKSVSVELKHDDKLPANSNVYIQAALLYTSIGGQRRLRILTLALGTTSSYTSLYPTCDLDTILNYITKIAIRSVLVSTPKSIRDNIITQAATMLACYRKNCSQSSTAGQLILPDTMKLLPVYIASLIKCDALIGNQTVTTDERSWLMHRLMSMNLKATSAYLYPRIYPLHTLDENQIPPKMIRCLSERLLETGAYVIENGLVMYIWLGSQVDPTFVQYLLGLPSVSHIQGDRCRIIEFDNPISQNVRKLMEIIRNERNCHMKLLIMQQRDAMEPFFRNYLVEDKGFTGGASYVDFLYHLHREIRNILQ